MAALSRRDAEDAFNQSPPFVDVDLFSSDSALRDAVAANGADAEVEALAAFGQRWGAAEMLDQARLANENPPKLRTYDPKGFRLDMVEFHPAYHRLMAQSMADGLHASTWEPDGSPAAASGRAARAGSAHVRNGVAQGPSWP